MILSFFVHFVHIWVEDKSEDCSVFSFKLTNHGDAQVSVWVQMKDGAGEELINQNVNIPAGAEEVVSFTYEGKAQMIFFFVDSTHEAGGDGKLKTVGMDALFGFDITQYPSLKGNVRDAAHHILYTVVNSAGMNGFVHGVKYVPGFAFYKLILIGWDVCVAVVSVILLRKVRKS